MIVLDSAEVVFNILRHPELAFPAARSLLDRSMGRFPLQRKQRYFLKARFNFFVVRYVISAQAKSRNKCIDGLYSRSFGRPIASSHGVGPPPALLAHRKADTVV